ncbi:hypothetical protein ACFR97_15360 [Haloplanus litoreus]|uniref:Uncharacterized protein n=1 Tax=Haloplanus litoreus TaxID=767515 RepID=A0ABD5ZWR7_9EURY
MSTLTDGVPTLLALVIVALFGVALWAMTTGRLDVAGLSFLSASLLIYLRERWVQRAAAD